MFVNIENKSILEDDCIYNEKKLCQPLPEDEIASLFAILTQKLRYEIDRQTTMI